VEGELHEPTAGVVAAICASTGRPPSRPERDALAERQLGQVLGEQPRGVGARGDVPALESHSERVAPRVLAAAAASRTTCALS
jgi:hypothetical protein